MKLYELVSLVIICSLTSIKVVHCRADKGNHYNYKLERSEAHFVQFTVHANYV